MKVHITFNGGPEWNPEDYSVPYHHITHGVSEEFMKKSLQWIYKIPGLIGASTDKPKELNTGINWITTLQFDDALDQTIDNKPATADAICDYIITEFKSNIIPELSKVGYNIDISTSL